MTAAHYRYADGSESVVLTCDAHGCGEEYVDTPDPFEDVRDRATCSGWTHRGGLDLCRGCST